MTFPIDPDTRMAMRIEGGPEMAGPLEMAHEALARHEGGNKYAALQDTFGDGDDDHDPLDGWDIDNIVEMLRGTLGSAESFAAEFATMSVEERAEHFPDPTVSELAQLWAQAGEDVD